MNNIEEDIKIVKEFNEKNRFRDCGIINNAIDHVLAEREADKKKIEELKEYIFIAPNLDEMTAAKYISIRRDAYIRGRADEQQKAEEIINKNYIPKQKVKDKIEDLKLSGGSNGKDNIENLARELATEALEELLEDK